MGPSDLTAGMLVLDANLMVILLLWILAIASVSAGYALGGVAWRAKFSVNLEIGDTRKRISGLWTELALISYVALLVVLVEKLTPSSDITTLSVKTWPMFPAFFVITAVLVIYHQRGQVIAARRTHSPGHAYRLAWGYAPYTLFSTVIFCMFFMASSLVCDQFFADKNAFVHHRLELESAYLALRAPDQGERTAGAMMIELERINGLLSTAIYAITEQINTVLIVLYCVLAINLLIEFTPMRHAYSPAAVVWTHFVVAAALLIVVGVAAYLYSTEYLGMLHGAITEISLVEKRIAHEGWEGARRYYELLSDIRGKQGFTGFILTMTTGRGGVAFFATALQAILSSTRKGRSKPNGAGH